MMFDFSFADDAFWTGAFLLLGCAFVGGLGGWLFLRAAKKSEGK